jgi:hypothetical protein
VPASRRSRPALRRPWRARPTLAALALSGLALTAACGADSGPRGLDAYCTDLAAQAELLNLDLVTPDDVDALVDRYEHFADTAPLAVEEQWRQLTNLATAAATVDLASEESRAAVVEQAASTERAVAQIAEHAAARCGVTLLMGTPPPATTTTLPAPATTAPATTVPPIVPTTVQVAPDPAVTASSVAPDASVTTPDLPTTPAPAST